MCQGAPLKEDPRWRPIGGELDPVIESMRVHGVELAYPRFLLV